MAKKEKDKPASAGPRMLNRKARHDYFIEIVVECGLELVGTEVKSLRAGQGRIDEAYARVQGDEVWLIGMNIATYPQAAPGMQHDPARKRKLLLHRRQVVELLDHAGVKGNTLIPLAVYFKKGWAKCELGLASGKRQYDKRQALKQRDAKREIAQEISKRRRG